MTNWSGRILIAVAAVAAVALVHSAAAESGEGRRSILVGPILTVPAPDGGPGALREFTVTLPAAEGNSAQRFVIQGEYRLLDTDETPRVEVVGERLLVLTDALIAVFDLESGEQVIDLAGVPEVVATGDGRRVAFKTLQPRFLPNEAISSVIQVLDVPSLAVEVVFPESSVIRRSRGRLLAWIDDPAERHFVYRVVLSPDGSRLAFFCHHPGDTPEAPGEIYLTVVELPEDLSRSRFVHELFDWMAYLRPKMAAGERRPNFAVESVIWTEDDALQVKTQPYARWLEREFTVPLPEITARPADEVPGEEGSAP